MQLATQLYPKDKLLTYLASKLSAEKFSLALLNGEDLRNEVVANGYQRQPLTNPIVTVLDTRLAFIADPVSFICDDKSYIANKFALVVESLPDTPIIACGDIDALLYRGDQINFDLSQGLLTLGIS